MTKGGKYKSKKTFVTCVAKDEEIAAWAIRSYRGDASWMVSSPFLGGGLAGDLWQGLRAHFVSRPFVHAICLQIAEIRDEVAVSIASQELGAKLYKENAEEFLRAMYVAHRSGQLLFGENDTAIREWVNSRIS